MASINHDIHGWYIIQDYESEPEDGSSLGFDGRKHYTDKDEARKVLLKKVRIYDNGGKSFDRYTVIFMDRPEYKPGNYEALAASANPFHALGFGQHTCAMPGRHLGKRITFEQCPEDVQQFIKQNL